MLTWNWMFYSHIWSQQIKWEYVIKVEWKRDLISKYNSLLWISYGLYFSYESLIKLFFDWVNHNFDLESLNSDLLSPNFNLLSQSLDLF